MIKSRSTLLDDSTIEREKSRGIIGKWDLGYVRRPKVLWLYKGVRGLVVHAHIVQLCSQMLLSCLTWGIPGKTIDRYRFPIWGERFAHNANLVLLLSIYSLIQLATFQLWGHEPFRGQELRHSHMTYDILAGQMCPQSLLLVCPCKYFFVLFLALWTLSFVICKNSNITALFHQKCCEEQLR